MTVNIHSKFVHGKHLGLRITQRATVPSYNHHSVWATLPEYQTHLHTKYIDSRRYPLHCASCSPTCPPGVCEDKLYTHHLYTLQHTNILFNMHGPDLHTGWVITASKHGDINIMHG